MRRLLRLIAGLGLLFAASWVGAGALAAKFGLSAFAKGAFATRALTAGLSLVGAQLLGGLSTPPVRDDGAGGSTGDRRTALEGNALDQGASMPFVLGSRRVYPPLIAEPLAYFDKGTEVVEGVFALAGPHDIEGVRVNGMPVEDMPGVEVQIRDATLRQPPQTMIRRYGATDEGPGEMTTHMLLESGTSLDLDSGSLDELLPQPHLLLKRARADEFWLHFVLPQGLRKLTSTGTSPARIPVRIRIKPRGGDWANLPEIHFRARTPTARRMTVRLIWQSDAPSPYLVNEPIGAGNFHSGNGVAEIRVAAPAQSGGSGGGWLAHEDFRAETGDDWVDERNSGLTRVRRATADAHEVRIYLDPDAFPPGEYDVEVIRGHAFVNTNYSAGTYTYNNVVRDFFGWYGDPPQIAEDQSEIQGSLFLQRGVSVVNETPTPDSRVAVIAMRARGVSVQRVSVMAHGLVRRWADDEMAAGDDPRDADWDTQNGASVADADGIWLGRYDRAVTVTSAGDADARIRSGEMTLPAGLWRFRAQVSPGEGDRIRLRVMRPVAGTVVTWDLDTLEVADQFGATGDIRGEPYARAMGGGVVECGFDLWLAEPEAVRLALGPGLAEDGASVIVVRAEVSAGWQALQRSDNPADLFRHALTNEMQAYPVEPGEIDEIALLDWRDRCERAGWRCNALIDGMTIADELRITAGAGYARPLPGGKVSIIQDYDRRDMEVEHVFTPRNSAGWGWRKGLHELPSGLRVTYYDAEGERREVIVLRDGVKHPYRRLEAVEYDSVTTEAEAIERARYDLRSSEHRRTVYAQSVPPAWLALQPGSLVGVVNDTLSDVMIAGTLRADSLVEAIGTDEDGYVLYITRDGEDFAFYTLITDQASMDTYYQSLGAPGWGDAETMADLGDMRRSGLVLGVSIQGEDGRWHTYEAAPFDGERRTLTLVDAPEGVLRAGAEVAIGVMGEMLRLVIADTRPSPDLNAEMTLVDEASAKIWG